MLITKSTLSVESVLYVSHMKKYLWCLCALLAITISVSAQQVTLHDLVDRAAKTTLARLAEKKLQDNELSITLIDLRDAKRPVTSSVRANERGDPASGVQLFYLV